MAGVPLPNVMFKKMNLNPIKESCNNMRGYKVGQAVLVDMKNYSSNPVSSDKVLGNISEFLTIKPNASGPNQCVVKIDFGTLDMKTYNLAGNIVFDIIDIQKVTTTTCPTPAPTFTTPASTCPTPASTCPAPVPTAPVPPVPTAPAPVPTAPVPTSPTTAPVKPSSPGLNIVQQIMNESSGKYNFTNLDGSLIPKDTYVLSTSSYGGIILKTTKEIPAATKDPKDSTKFKYSPSNFEQKYNNNNKQTSGNIDVSIKSGYQKVELGTNENLEEFDSIINNVLSTTSSVGVTTVSNPQQSQQPTSRKIVPAAISNDNTNDFYINVGMQALYNIKEIRNTILNNFRVITGTPITELINLVKDIQVIFTALSTSLNLNPAISTEEVKNSMNNLKLSYLKALTNNNVERIAIESNNFQSTSNFFFYIFDNIILSEEIRSKFAEFTKLLSINNDVLIKPVETLLTNK
jgi:hypothetical protein